MNMLILFVACISCTRQIEDVSSIAIDDWWRPVKGSVYSIHETSYMLTTGDQDELKRSIRARRKGDRNDVFVTFNENGKISVLEEYDRRDNLIQKRIKQYDEKSRLTSEQVLDRNKRIKYLVQWTSEQSKVFTKTLSPDSMVLSTKEYSYNSKLETLEETSFYAMGGVARRIYYKYNSKHQPVEVRYFSEKDINHTTKSLTYNKEGFLSDEITYNAQTGDIDTHWSYAYTYDHLGNWITCRESLFSSPRYEIVRDIVYQK